MRKSGRVGKRMQIVTAAGLLLAIVFAGRAFSVESEKIDAHVGNVINEAGKAVEQALDQAGKAVVQAQKGTDKALKRAAEETASGLDQAARVTEEATDSAGRAASGWLKRFGRSIGKLLRAIRPTTDQKNQK
ncbi:hypothetical protein K8S19_13705 [bacterium]|nr:hypothetical protein [bacterium]